ncbi:hemerythrin domain-containing protein [Herbidospora sp. NBRC 101105]|uniref:hemerythrin domain-containing protein n=1 Tax=Herbidospora sp. NBRC 101105 TaxID=3032195 RepID=UPI0024A48BBC|nr:hemerythrin domain-containing protein [Herbidospora sp. NBRC 101105]GLX96625.1 hemerythrin [Herbidospora sp. NBRC 101105]
MNAQHADVVAFLIRQHSEIKDLFAEVEAAEGDAREEAFRRLVHLLAVHETAEEELVHPYVRQVVDGGDGIVDDRLREENEAKQLLSDLDEMGSQHPDFLKHLEVLRKDVLTHARAEERYEFPHLTREGDPARLTKMTAAVQAAEKMAPTRPHPGVESATKNLLLGAPMAIMDRARDAIRKAMGEGK